MYRLGTYILFSVPLIHKISVLSTVNNYVNVNAIYKHTLLIGSIIIKLYKLNPNAVELRVNSYFFFIRKRGIFVTGTRGNAVPAQYGGVLSQRVKRAGIK